MVVNIIGNAEFKSEIPAGQKWVINETKIKDPDRWFQLHPRSEIDGNRKDKSHLKNLKKAKCTVYTQAKFEDIPNSTPFPFEEYELEFGTIFGSTVDYMLAMAIKEGAEVINIIGVDMANWTEYAYQRPSCMYLIGLARGRGIEVNIDPDSKLNVRQRYAIDQDFVLLNYLEDLSKIRKDIDGIERKQIYTDGIVDTLVGNGVPIPQVLIDERDKLDIVLNKRLDSYKRISKEIDKSSEIALLRNMLETW